MVLGITIALYALLAKVNKRWLAIPVCAFTGLAVALTFGAGFDIEFVTEPGLPNLNPAYWWGNTEARLDAWPSKRRALYRIFTFCNSSCRHVVTGFSWSSYLPRTKLP